MAYDVQVGTVPLKLDFVASGGSKDGSSAPTFSANGTLSFQNISPSELQFSNQQPGFGDQNPYSSRTYATANGSIGKYSEIEAPNDFAQVYLMDLDGTRPGILAPRLAYAGAGGAATVTFQPSPGGGSRANQPMVMVDTFKYGLGAICTISGGTDPGEWWYQWDQTNKRYNPLKRLNIAVQPSPAIAAGGQVRAPYFTSYITEVNGHVWMSNVATGGMIDASLAYPQATILAGTQFLHTVALGNYMVTFELQDNTGATGGINISMRDPATLTILKPTTLSGIDASPEMGNANIVCPVPNCLSMHAPVVFAGAIYWCDDRGVFKTIFDETECRLLTVPIRTKFSRVTGNPEIFQGSLFVPSGNQLWRWTPGQSDWTPVLLDPNGVLPTTLGSGVIISLLTLSTGLFIGAQSTFTAADSALIRMDSNGVFSIIDVSLNSTGVLLSNANSSPGTGLIWFIDAGSASYSPVIGFLAYNASATVFRVVPQYESSKEAGFLPAASRPQVGGSHFWIGAWDNGGAYIDRKDQLRLVADATDVNASKLIKIYYQTDYNDKAADDMDAGHGGFGGAINQTLMANQGAWKVALILSNVTPGFNAIGAGFTGFTELSMTATQVQYRRIRWAVEIIGDTTGTLYPRLYGFRFIYSETPTMYVVWTIRVRILCDDPDLQDPGLTTPPPHTPADVYAIWQTLWGYAKAGTFVSFIDVDGGSRVVKFTKFIFNERDLMENSNAGGAPTLNFRRTRGVTLTLALQEADPAA